MDPIKVQLDYPITHGTDTIAEFVCERRLKAKDFKGIKSNEIKFDDMLVLIRRVFAQPDSVVSELDASDMFKCSEVINGFLPTGQQTGETP